MKAHFLLGTLLSILAGPLLKKRTLNGRWDRNRGEGSDTKLSSAVQSWPLPAALKVAAARFSRLPLRRAQTGENKDCQFSCPQTSSWLNPRFSANETILQLFRTKSRAVFITKMILIISITFKCIKKKKSQLKETCRSVDSTSGWRDGGWVFLFVCLFIYFSFVWRWTCVSLGYGLYLTYTVRASVNGNAWPQGFIWKCPSHRAVPSRNCVLFTNVSLSPPYQLILLAPRFSEHPVGILKTWDQNCQK